MTEKSKPYKKTQQLSRAVLKTVAGMVASSPQDLVRVAANAGDNFLKGQFSQALAETYTYFINQGSIDPKYLDSRHFADLAPEFAVINEKSFGIEKLNDLRKIFANLAIDNGEDSHKKYLLDIALTMDEPEIKVLLADQKLATDQKLNAAFKHPANIYGNAEWQRIIAAISGLKHAALVGLYAEKLEKKMLINQRLYPDKSGIGWDPRTSRLTDMGMDLCELLTLEGDPIQEI